MASALSADAMTQDGSGQAGPARADRLKAALKANLARRKAQARARTQDSAETAPPASRADAGDRAGKDKGDG